MVGVAEVVFLGYLVVYGNAGLLGVWVIAINSGGWLFWCACPCEFGFCLLGFGGCLWVLFGRLFRLECVCWVTLWWLVC